MQSLTRILFGLLAAGSLSAQIGGGSIVGMVTDPSGAPVPNVQVTAHRTDTNEERTVATNGEGYYEFPLLAAGRYYLRAEASGFKALRGEVFTLSTGTRPRIDLALTVGAQTETIQVTDTAPLINSTTTDLGAVMSRARVDELPLNGRNFQDMVNLQAGTTSGLSRGGISFHGSTSLGTNFLLDGVDMSFGEVNGSAGFASAGGSGIINTVSIEAIEEFKSTSSADSAEFGRSGGGVLNITTRSGSNNFHGTLFEYFQNDDLNANAFFANKNGTGKTAERYNQYGGNLGGPIRHDKLFFFFNYEGDQVRRLQYIQGNVPTQLLLSEVSPAIRTVLTTMMPPATIATSNPLIGVAARNDHALNNENTFLTRLDWLISARQRLSVRDSYNDQTTTTPNLEPTMPTIYPLKLQNFAVEHTFNVSATALNEFRLGFNRVDLFRQPEGWQNIPGYITAQGISASFSNFIHFLPTTYSLSDNFTFIRGRHSIKMGLDERNVRSVRFQGGPPTYAYNTTTDLINQTPASVSLYFTTSKGMRTFNMGYFVQDDWRVSAKVQVNLGLRWEYSPPFRGGFNINSSNPFGPFISAGQPEFAPDYRNWGPHAGIAWMPDGHEHTVLRAGGAINYVQPQAIFYYDFAFINPLLTGTSTFAPGDIPAQYFTYPNAVQFQTILEGNTSQLPANFKPTRVVADYNSRTTYVGTWNVSLQREVTKTLAVQASYVGQRTVNLFGARPLNLVDPAIGQRPVANLGQINFEENAGRITYHALELSANQRLWRGLNFDAYFTLASMTGYYLPDDTVTEVANNLQDPNNIAGSSGPLGSQAKRVFRGVFSYAIPGGTHLHNRFLHGLTSGWTLRAILGWRSGIPFNVLSGNDYVGNGRSTGQRPDAVGGVDPYLDMSNTTNLMYLNPAAFSIAAVKAQKRFGNLGFDALWGPTQFTMDTGLHKSFRVTEKQSLTFRLEAFNTLNHQPFSNPVATLNNAQFGQFTGTSVAARVVQLALKYAF